MTYTKPDPRYDYRKLDAFITGVNSIGSKLSVPKPIIKFHGMTYATRNKTYTTDAEMMNILRDCAMRDGTSALDVFHEGLKCGRIQEIE